MDILFKQIRKALDEHLYYLSLCTSLMIPSICGAMSSADGEDTGEKYAQWFDKFVASRYSGNFTGHDCYRFRCSLLHQGRTQHSKGRYSRIIFLEPGSQSSGLTLHNNVLGDALNIDVHIFCSDIVDGAELWHKQAVSTPEYQANYAKFAARHPDGLKPYIVGVPVIG